MLTSHQTRLWAEPRGRGDALVGAGWDWSRAMPGGGRKLRPIPGTEDLPGEEGQAGAEPRSNSDAGAGSKAGHG